MTYMVELMHKNLGNTINVVSKAKLFEYGVLEKKNEYANQMLK